MLGIRGMVHSVETSTLFCVVFCHPSLYRKDGDTFSLRLPSQHPVCHCMSQASPQPSKTFFPYEGIVWEMVSRPSTVLIGWPFPGSSGFSLWWRHSDLNDNILGVIKPSEVRASSWTCRPFFRIIQNVCLGHQLS